jgi:hypothetical protein
MKNILEIPRAMWNQIKNAENNRVIAVATVFIAVSAIAQYCEMRNSGKETAEQTDRMIQTANQIKCALIAANKHNSEAVASTLRQNQEQFASTLGEMQKQSRAMSSAAIASKNAADQTKRLADDTEKASADTKTLAETQTRPWVGIDGFPSDISVNGNGTGIDFTIRLIDYGQSPAIAVLRNPRFVLVHARSVGDELFENNDVCAQGGKGKLFMENSLQNSRRTDFVAPGISGVTPQPVSAAPAEGARLDQSTHLIGCIVYRSPAGNTYYTRVGYYLTVTPTDHGPSFSIDTRAFYALH